MREKKKMKQRWRLVCEDESMMIWVLCFVRWRDQKKNKLRGFIGYGFQKEKRKRKKQKKKKNTFCVSFFFLKPITYQTLQFFLSQIPQCTKHKAQIIIDSPSNTSLCLCFFFFFLSHISVSLLDQWRSLVEDSDGGLWFLFI